MSSTQKKVILRLVPGDVLHGYLPASGFIQQGQVTYLNLHGRVATISLLEVKMISYVRDFNLADQQNPERLQRRSFLSRPRAEGLWVRITFREDADVLEGLAPGDTSLLDGFVHDAGVYFVPPEARINTQRIYVPRAAMKNFEVVALITQRRKSIGGNVPKHDGIHSEIDVSTQTPLFEDAPDLPVKRGNDVRR